jgi:hypothetical protein
MDEEMLVILVGWPVASLVTGTLLHLDRRRLDAYGRSRMWNGATLALVVSNMFLPMIFIPTPVCFGAHVWLTRRGPWWLRLLKGLAGAMVAMTIFLLVDILALRAVGVKIELM